jgi:hypothetical protein
MENRDRAMQFEVDRDVHAVLEFMQSSIPAAKLVRVAESAAEMGRLLWGKYPQESCSPISLSITKCCPSLSDASECSLAPPNAGDGSGAAMGGR